MATYGVTDKTNSSSDSRPADRAEVARDSAERTVVSPSIGQREGPPASADRCDTSQWR